MSTTTRNQVVSSIWLELTGRCQLACNHCYADSGPTGSHGTMTGRDWIDVIDEALNMGCELVQIIGGEPTLHPEFELITRHALKRGLDVEIATNLVHVPSRLWDLYTESANLSLSVSYYDARPEVHALVTGTKGSHARTRANLVESVERGVRVRVNVIRVNDVQDVDATLNDLHWIGVDDVGVDDVRGIGRGSCHTSDDGMGSLCGDCGNGKAAILPSGDVSPCVIGRRHVVGNVRDASLREVVVSEAMKDTVRAIKEATAWECKCAPDPCTPDGLCAPVRDCRPTRRCRPSK